MEYWRGRRQILIERCECRVIECDLCMLEKESLKVNGEELIGDNSCEIICGVIFVQRMVSRNVVVFEDCGGLVLVHQKLKFKYCFWAVGCRFL